VFVQVFVAEASVEASDAVLHKNDLLRERWWPLSTLRQRPVHWARDRCGGPSSSPAGLFTGEEVLLPGRPDDPRSALKRSISAVMYAATGAALPGATLYEFVRPLGFGLAYKLRTTVHFLLRLDQIV
jgi:hypothetical protein